MTAKEIYERIDLSQLPEEKADKLRQLEVKTKGFTISNDKVDESMRNLYAQLKEKKPSALKDLKVEIKKEEIKKGDEVIVKETEEVVGKKEVTKKTPTPSSGKKETITEVAKKIRKADEPWRTALKRAGEQMRNREDEANKQVKTELQKLIEFVKNDPNFKDFPRTYGKGRKDIDLLKDASEKALAPGRRVSKKGHMNQYGASKGGRKYTENRDNRSDREASKFNKNIFLAKGGRVHRAEQMENGGEVFVPVQILANNPDALVNTTTMNELFAKGGITSPSLFKLQDEVWDKFKFESGAEIKGTQQNRMKFSKAMDEALKSRGVAKESLSLTIFEKLEDENAHTLNEFLILNDYYKPSVWPEGKEFYLDRAKKNPRSGLGKDGIVSATTKAPKSTSKGYKSHDTIKLIIIKNPNTNSKKNFLQIDGSDVLNGVYDSTAFAQGGTLPKGYKYIRRGDISQVVTKKNEIIFNPKNGFWVNKDALLKAGMNEESTNEKYEFPIGQVVWDKGNKTYGVVLNNFGDPENGDRGEIRLDSDGMQSIRNYPDTKYNLVPIGSKEDKGDGNLEELKESAKRIIGMAKDAELKDYYKKAYKRVLAGEFDKFKKMESGGEVFVPVQIDANNPDVLVQTTTMSELFENGGRIKGRNNETGESFGVVIDSAKRYDEGFGLVVRKGYGSRMHSYKFLFDDDGNLKEIVDYGYSLDGSVPDLRGSYSVIDVFERNKSVSLKEIGKLTSPAFAKKVYDFVQENKYEKGGKVYASDDAYRVDVIVDGEVVETLIIRGRNKAEIRMMIEDMYEDKMEDKYGEDVMFEIIEAKAEGGKIGFEALSEKVAARYVGEKVKPKYQDEYGKTYSAEEAKEVGDKVAAKVYREQQAKMADGGKLEILDGQTFNAIVSDVRKKTDLSRAEIYSLIEDFESRVVLANNKEKMAEGGFVAIYNGKKINIEADSLYAAKLKAIEELKVPKSKEGLLSVVSNKSMANQDFRFMADGGRLEAQSLEMAQNISVQIAHHAMELKEALEGKTYVEPWVTSMLQRAADNLSDATHYLEGKEENMAKGGYVAVAEKDGYWYIISTPSSKENSQKLLDMTTLMRGEVGKVVTIDEAKDYNKVIGREYLEKDGMMAKGGRIREFDDVLIISKNRLGMVEAIADNIYYVTTPFGETFEATIDDLKKIMSFDKGGEVMVGEIASIAKENKATGDEVVKKISKGADVEMEHTEDRKVAMRIAVDHLKEDFNYYEKLSKAGL
jgi:hypothetical protein